VATNYHLQTTQQATRRLYPPRCFVFVVNDHHPWALVTHHLPRSDDHHPLLPATPLLEREVDLGGVWPTTTLCYLLPPTIHHLHPSLARMRGGGALLPTTTHCSPPLPCSNVRWRGSVARYHPLFSTPPLLEREVEGFRCPLPPTILYPSLART